MTCTLCQQHNLTAEGRCPHCDELCTRGVQNCAECTFIQRHANTFKGKGPRTGP